MCHICYNFNNNKIKNTQCCDQLLCIDCYIKIEKYECPYCREKNPIMLNLRQRMQKNRNAQRIARERLIEIEMADRQLAEWEYINEILQNESDSE